jgi:cardiolipin-specific phospholipase
LKRLQVILSAELEILNSLVTSTFQKRLVPLPNNEFINTLTISEEAKDKPALVLAHGWGSGLAFFAKNLDVLSNQFRVYCFDWIGSGGSSRPRFDTSMSPEQSESFFIQRFEEWTRRVGLEHDKFIFVGHSLGGYLAAVYALKHPERLRGLALISPFGIPSRQLHERGKVLSESHQARGGIIRDSLLPAPAAGSVLDGRTEPRPNVGMRDTRPANLPPKYKFLRNLIGAAWHLNVTPQRVLRWTSTVSQTWGRDLIYKYISLRFASSIVDEQERERFARYLHAISVAPGSAEFAMNTLMYPGAWARAPLMDRLKMLSPKVPVVFLYGDHDWMNPIHAQELIQKSRAQGHEQMLLEIVPNSGHYLFIENPANFNEVFLHALNHHILGSAEISCSNTNVPYSASPSA